MQLHIITPEKALYSGEADMVTCPGVEGEFGVLAGHMPFVSGLRPGAVTVMKGGLVAARLAVIEGIAEVTPERCTILIEAAISLEQRSETEAAAELRAAEEAVAAALTPEEGKAAARRKAMAETVMTLLRHH